VEKELATEKRFNKMAMGVIILLLCIMSVMVVNMRFLSARCEILEKNYEILYEELSGEQGR